MSAVDTAENDALATLTRFEREMVGPIRGVGCNYWKCGRAKAEHRESFMDLRPEVIDHTFEPPPPRPLPHECVPAMITTEWRCHACGADNDVWGTGATESYMECGHCFAHSWLYFDPDGFDADTRVTPPAVTEPGDDQ